ncbi:activin receptor type-2B [Patella vulgata]|uniref:activin receptor type-2B n=1 Tax=Patella vulgata TaxID=6465 RepID=UPI00217F48E2|nr:activin receptor type-2B [Patella vulgata]
MNVFFEVKLILFLLQIVSLPISYVRSENPAVLPVLECEKYDHTCDPAKEKCQTVDRCVPHGPEGKVSCYASWRNGTDGFKNMKKGCWLNSENCLNDTECIENTPNREIYFCCCQKPMCNGRLTLRPVISPPTTTSSSTTKVRESGDGQLMRTLMYSIVPILGTALLIVVIFWMWRWHQRRTTIYHEQLPTADPALLNTPCDEALRPLQLLELRARGRFGAVWKAQLISDFVAVKIFPLQDKLSWVSEHDIYVLPQMKHENILNFIAVEKRGESLNTELWLITEFHELGSLCDYLKCHTITWSELCKIAESMAKGLAYLHDEIPATKDKLAKPAVAHRDFKSKNVLLKSDLTACVGDFGLALKFEPGISPGETHGLVGTRRYMAPEILEGAICFNRDAFLRIDMYACGLVLWELVARCSARDGPVEEYILPFEEEIGAHPTLEEMQDMVVTRKIRPAIKDNWLTHPGLAALVSTIEECWDQDAEARLSAGCVQERISQLSRNVNVSTSINQMPDVVIPLDMDLPPKDISI